MKEMKKLEDITYRHELIERYLNADALGICSLFVRAGG